VRSRNFLWLASGWMRRTSKNQPWFIQHLKTPFFLLAMTILTYGLLLPQLGFYWDDWPWIWIQHVDGKAGMLQIDWPFRPMAGLVLWLFSLVGGENPIVWQGINLLLRWLSSLSAYLALAAIFPLRKESAVWAALLFLLYPGYTHQFVAVNSSRHLLPYSFYFLSLTLMARSIEKSASNQSARTLKVGALALQALAMLTTEYFYGLELVRPLIVWIIVGRQFGGKKRLQGAFRESLPYLAIFLIIVLWRLAITRLPGYSNYAVGWGESDGMEGSAPIRGLLFAWLRQLVVGLICAWSRGLSLSFGEDWGLLKSLALVFLSLFGGLSVGTFFTWEKPRDEPASGKGFVLLGAGALALGGLPFLAANLTMEVSFPASRLTLPMAWGSSILLVALLDGLPVRRGGKIALLAVLSGLAVGAHFQNAVAFQRDWAYQRSFFEQLRWRAPYIRPGTLILSNQIAETHSSDNSLTAALNWFYFDRLTGNDLPLLMFYVETRAATYFPTIERGIRVERRYGRFLFRGSTDQVLVLYFDPPACLRLLDPAHDGLNPTLNREIRELAWVSDLELIQERGPSEVVDFPLVIRNRAKAWCYAYQKAELARQSGRWDEITAWSEKALEWKDSPNRADEWLPFIQAFAYTGDTSQAVELTRKVVKINSRLRPLLCQVWREIENNTGPSLERERTLQEVNQLLGCAE
jgi:hypothetical protein